MSYAESFPAPPWAMRRMHRAAAHRARMMAVMTIEDPTSETDGPPAGAEDSRGRRGGRRGGPHGRPGPGPWGGRGQWGPPRGRRRDRGDVRAAILLLLAEKPRHGYEIITELADRSDGQWQPSPGSIYPVLKRLARDGIVTASHEEGKRIFSLSDTGRALVETEGESWGQPWLRTEDEGSSAADQLWSEFRQLAMATKQIDQLSDPAQLAASAAILTEARKRIYGLLAE